MSNRRLISWLLTGFVFLLLLLAPASISAQQVGNVTYHQVNWGSTYESRFIQMFRANHWAEVTGARNVAVVLYRDVTTGAEIAVVTASVNHKYHKGIVYDIFVNGKHARTERFDLQGRSKDGPARQLLLRLRPGESIHSEQLLEAWTTMNGVSDRVTRGESERQPCMDDGRRCWTSMPSNDDTGWDGYFPKMTDFNYNVRWHGDRKVRQAADAALVKYLQIFKDTGFRIGPLPASAFTAPVNGAVTATPQQGALVDQLSGRAPPPAGTGGIDLSTVELRYLADPGPEKGMRYSMRGAAAPQTINHEAGAANLAKASDAFFVWLSLPASKFWVNLNPAEPDRIIDPQLATTDAGHVLLRADLELKKSVARLIHPDTELGARFWEQLRSGLDEQLCLSFRQWIVPAPATVRVKGDSLYILDAPLTVKLESEYLTETHGQSGPQCSSGGQGVEEHNEQVFRSLILPEVQKAVDSAPEYADLRRVHLSRVAAEWYRGLSSRHATTYAEFVDSGNATSWPAREQWSPTAVFDDYVASYTNGEFNVTRQREEGDYIITHTYFFGGVDFGQVTFNEIDETTFQRDWPGSSAAVSTSHTRLSTGGQGEVWLGVPGTSRPAPVIAAAQPETPSPINRWKLAGIVTLVLLVALIARQLARKTPVRKISRHEATVGGIRTFVLRGAATTVRIPPGIRNGNAIRFSANTDGEPQMVTVRIRVRRVPRTVKYLVGIMAVVTTVVWANGGDDQTPPGSPPPVAKAQAMPRPVIATPATPPLRVETSRKPPPPPIGDGTCLGGVIPDITVPTPANGVTRVDCGTPEAHYQVIQTIPGTSDMTRCDANPRTQYAYSETITRNGVPVNEFVYCLIGLGSYAR